jgi:hypothetical protein
LAFPAGIYFAAEKREKIHGEKIKFHLHIFLQEAPSAIFAWARKRNGDGGFGLLMTSQPCE